jgi:hypothetical protein
MAAFSLSFKVADSLIDLAIWLILIGRNLS